MRGSDTVTADAVSTSYSAETAESEEVGSSVELQLLTIKECFVYKVPPLRTSSGHRAEDWDLANPVFTGCMKIAQQGAILRIKIFAFIDSKNASTSDENTQLFGECPIEAKPGDSIVNFVDAVIDSSRYYVLRLKDPNSTRSTMIGVGFREREQAFDFKNCLNEYVRFIDRQHRAQHLAAAPLKGAAEARSADSGEDEANDESCDLHSAAAPAAQGAWVHIEPLKEGEKIKITAPSGGSGRKKTAAGAAGAAGAGAGGGLALKPPPPPGSIVHFSASTNSPVPQAAAQQQQQSAAAAADADADDEWGDFNSAT